MLKSKTIRTALVLVIALLVSSIVGMGGTSPTFAAEDTEYPLTFPEMPLHDPFILADQATQTYYLYTATQRSMLGNAYVRGVMAYKAKI